VIVRTSEAEGENGSVIARGKISGKKRGILRGIARDNPQLSASIDFRPAARIIGIDNPIRAEFVEDRRSFSPAEPGKDEFLS
jgi:hypothetical protein